jgi:hypothetical protein
LNCVQEWRRSGQGDKRKAIIVMMFIVTDSVARGGFFSLVTQQVCFAQAWGEK